MEFIQNHTLDLMHILKGGDKIMKFITKDAKDKEKIVSLKLVPDDDGCVSLIATDHEGEEWYLMEFKEGRYEVIDYVDSKIGIDVNSKGAMKEKK